MDRVDVKRIRSERGVSQKRLAELTEYNQGFVSLIENGKVKAPQLFLDRLKECLNVEDISVYQLKEEEKVEAEVEENAEVEKNRAEAPEVRHSVVDVLASDGFVVDKLLAIIENQHQLILTLMAKIDALEKTKN